jgi:peptide/nickel transport system substrate-binding protein
VISKLSVRAAALLAAFSFGAASCGSTAGTQTMGPGYDLASQQILNPSTHTGGTINLVSSASGGFDSLDPGNTYEAATWDLFRTFGRPMITFAHQPGTGGNTLVPDLAAGLGTVSTDGLTWTYKLKTGVTFEDGTPITAKDVKWAIERSNWSTVHSNAPTYFINILTPPSGGTKIYSNWDVYKQGDLPASIIDASDDQQLIFHLPKPFGEFNYLMTLPGTMPVPYQKDKADPSGYANHPTASGGYKIASYSAGKELKLVRNAAFNAASDPLGLHKAYADTIDVQLGLNPADRDQRLLTGAADMDLIAALTVANHAAVLSDPVLKSQTDDTVDGSLVYAALNTSVITDPNCRKAIEYGIDKEAVLNELGGPYGGTIATSMLPSTIPGHASFDLYGHFPDKAKASLAACNLPKDANGRYQTVIAAATSNPDIDNAAVAMQASLKDIGIDAKIELYPFAQFSSSFAGETSYANSHGLGIILSIWAADWPSGYGFLDQILTKDGIAAPGVGGGSNFAQYDNAAVDKLFADALGTDNATTQHQDWAAIDRQAMADAMAVPLVERRVLRFRSTRLSNVFINSAYGAYDLASIGLK